MEKHGRKFKAEEKLKILEQWKERGGGRRNANYMAYLHFCSAQSIYNWQRRYDGTLESLENGDQTPHRLWNKTPEEELNAVAVLVKRYEGCGSLELYGRLQIEIDYDKSPRTFWRHMKTLKIPQASDIERHEIHDYETPKYIGTKWQIDVKWVPARCLTKIPGSAFYDRRGLRFYQYTCIDEASRKRFIFFYSTYGKVQTEDFLKRCFNFFGYMPHIVQSDNGAEFCDFTEAGGRKLHKRIKVNGVLQYSHPVTQLLAEHHIRHKLIKVATPRHNGKVERSHRTDNREFYRLNDFVDLQDLREKGKDWLYRYNNIRVHSSIGYKTPQASEAAQVMELAAQQNQINYVDAVRSLNGRVELVQRQGTVHFTDASPEQAYAPSNVAG